MSRLPNGWVMGLISDLVEVGPKNHCDDSTIVGFIPMNRMGKRFLDIPTFESRKWSEVKKGYTHFGDGDVLLARITPCFENGKSGIARGLPNGLGAGSTEYIVLRPKHEVATAEYVLARLKSEEFMLKGARSMTGAVGQQRVPKPIIESFPIPIAPFREQKRISHKLTALLDKVDKCRERLDRVPQILKKFREAVLEAAVSGRLTEEWRGGQVRMSNAKDELEEIAKAKRTWTAENATHNEVSRIRKRAEAFSSNALSNQNLPDGWVWAPIEDACLLVVDCHNKTAPYVEAGIPLVRTSNVRDGKIEWNEMRFVNATTYQFWSRRCPPAPGDIIFTREAPIGEVALIPDGLTICLGQRTMLFRPIQEFANARFLLLALQTPTFKRRSIEAAVGTGVKHLRVGDVGGLQIPIAPLREQIEIVRRVTELFSFADTLQQRYAEAIAGVERLTPSVLTKAFRGELVPQDPGDEPAGEMLQRLLDLEKGHVFAKRRINSLEETHP